jgi:hypothetical protein
MADQGVGGVTRGVGGVTVGVTQKPPIFSRNFINVTPVTSVTSIV